MPKYAADTKVSRSKSRDQIEAILMRCGAREIFTNDMNSHNTLFVAWKIHGKPYKFVLPMPAPDDIKFTRTATGLMRGEAAAMDSWQKAVRQYWRIAREYIYMLTEMMEACGMEFHEAFAPLLALSDGGNVWQIAAVNADAIQHQGTLLELMGPEKKRGR
ncbi:MAG: hypothetical protein ACE1Y4_16365 [Lysobacterales bacterium]